MSYTIYDPATGEIEEYGTGEAQAPVGKAVHDSALSNMTHYFLAGVPTPYTTEQSMAKAERPAGPYSWNNATMSWEAPLSAIKEAKNEQINRWRLDANRGSFWFQGHEIACDTLSRGDIDGVIGEVALTGSLPVTFPGVWKTKANAWVSIPDVATWTLFVQAMVAQGSVNFAHAQALKTYLYHEDRTAEEVEAIQWGMTIPA